MGEVVDFKAARRKKIAEDPVYFLKMIHNDIYSKLEPWQIAVLNRIAEIKKEEHEQS